jgi:HPr kinase/phosphorylase
MSVSIKDFLVAAEQHQVPIVVEGGKKYVDRVIREEAINRPGLALANFFQYFANNRVQVFGLAENTYLKSLDKDERMRRLEGVLSQSVPCLVFTRSRRPTKAVLELAEAYHTPVLRSPLITSRFINQATLILENLAAPTIRLHGSMLDILGVGVLIEGDPGVGKSEAALGLVERGHSLVADDMTIFHRDNRSRLVGSAPDITRYHMEIRGLGIINVPSLFGMASITQEKQLDLIIRLYAPTEDDDLDRVQMSPQTRTLLQVEIPLVTLPVRAGRDMSNVIEVAAMNQKLRILGHDAVKDFNQNLINSMKKLNSDK